jgi:hypothetical protein
MLRSRVVNAIGLAMTSTVLVVILITKFTRGAWLSLLAMAVIFFIMNRISAHYVSVSEELSLDHVRGEERALPARVHAIVLVSKVHRPTLRAIAYARASRPSELEAVTVDVEPEETRDLVDTWDRLSIPVPLKVLHSPFREISRPIIDYVTSVHRSSPRDLVSVFVPEYVVGRWWEHFLHNQSALRLKARLLFTPGVMVVSVPWQLESSALGPTEEDDLRAPGAVRQGRTTDSVDGGAAG